MATSAKNRRKKIIKNKINNISYITTWRSSIKLGLCLGGPLSKLLKSLRSTTLDGGKSKKKKKKKRKRKISNDISVTTWRISTKLDSIVPRGVSYKTCTNRSTSVHKMKASATDETKTKKNNFKQYLLSWLISTKLDRIVPWEVLFQNCSNCLTPLHKMAASAKNRKKTSYNISSIITWRILKKKCANRSTSAQNRGQSYRKKKKKKKKKKKTHTLKSISSITTWRISPQLNGIIPWKIHCQNCSNCSTSLPKVAARAKNRKKKKKKASNNISSVTTEGISTKLDKIVFWEVLYQNGSNRSALLNKMATDAKKKKKKKKKKKILRNS